MHENGTGVPRDYKEAFSWYDKAARKGEADAQANLGRMYLQGLGTRKDLIIAYAWFHLAAEQGIKNAQLNESYAYNKLNNAEKKQARKLAKQYLEKYSKK